MFQAMYKQACALGLTIPYREDANVKLLVRMTIALALLPADLAVEGYTVSFFSLVLLQLQFLLTALK